MDALHKVVQPTSASSYGCSQVCGKAADVTVPDHFPAGLRVLVVDDDLTCLTLLERMLCHFSYHVTTCSQATVALDLLRERKGCFDIVLSDVYMPDMDGYKLLECVGLEMDLPVIMVSSDGSTNAVMRGIRHGACDYLIKPIRAEELQNIWQHVVRKKWNENKEFEHSGSMEDNERTKRGSVDADGSAVNEGVESMLKAQKKRSNAKEEDDTDLDNDDPATSKKPRVVWSVELHQQFVSAVHQLGIDKAVPKRILELMNVPGLTRENVASHLQKFRLYLKRLSGVAQQQGGISTSFCGPVDPNVKMGSVGRFDIQALAASGQIPPQTLAALHSELLGRPTSNLVLPAFDPPALLQASLPVPKCTSVENGVAFCQPLVKSPSNVSKHYQQSILSTQDAPTDLGPWQSTTISSVGNNNIVGGSNSSATNTLMDIFQRQQHPYQQKPQQRPQIQQQKQQQHQQQQQQQQQPLPEPSRLINVQPSCLVVPQSSANFQAGSPASVNQDSTFNRSTVVNYSLPPYQVNAPLNTGLVSDRDLKVSGVPSGYSVQGFISPSVSSCSENADTGNSCQLGKTAATCISGSQAQVLAPKFHNIQGSYDAKLGTVLDQGLLKNLGYVSKGSGIASRFSVDDYGLPGKVHVENDGNRVKQEPSFDFVDAKVGIPVMQRLSSNDLMSVFTD